MVEKKCQSNAKTSLCLPERSLGYLRLFQNRDAPNLGSVVPPDQLKSIHSVLKGDGETKRKFVVNEMQFNVPKKTMTITATPY